MVPWFIFCEHKNVLKLSRTSCDLLPSPFWCCIISPKAVLWNCLVPNTISANFDGTQSASDYIMKLLPYHPFLIRNTYFIRIENYYFLTEVAFRLFGFQLLISNCWYVIETSSGIGVYWNVKNGKKLNYVGWKITLTGFKPKIHFTSP